MDRERLEISLLQRCTDQMVSSLLLLRNIVLVRYQCVFSLECRSKILLFSARRKMLCAKNWRRPLSKSSDLQHSTKVPAVHPAFTPMASCEGPPRNTQSSKQSACHVGLISSTHIFLFNKFRDSFAYFYSFLEPWAAYTIRSHYSSFLHTGFDACGCNVFHDFAGTRYYSRFCVTFGAGRLKLECSVPSDSCALGCVVKIQVEASMVLSNRSQDSEGDLVGAEQALLARFARK